MKRFTTILTLLIALVTASYAQKVIPANIYIIDAQSGTTVPAISPAAISFESTLIALVSNTNSARTLSVAHFGPGKRSYTITQVDPAANGYAYSITLQRTFLGQVATVYSFQYSVDQNKLYVYDEASQNWLEETVQGNNMINLNNCQILAAFNAPAQQQQAAQPVQQVADNTQPADNGPVDDSQAVDVNVQAPTAPPAIPDYEQPECPQDGYLWQPGYWAYSTESANYYWVPGVWVAPPTVGFLWTPPYWGLEGGFYGFHAGYWGNTIGFYGGIDYGFGYGGVGFVGGEWRGGFFSYNTAVVRVNFHTHVYVDNHYSGRIMHHESFNGRGGAMARPNAREMQAMHERHVMSTPEQNRNQLAARNDKGQFAGAGGRPGNLANKTAPTKNEVNNKVAANGGNRPGGAGAAGGNRQGGVGAAGGARPGAGAPGAGGARPGAGAPGAGGARPGAGAPGAGGARPGAGAPGAGGARPGAPGGAPGGGRPGGAPGGAPGGRPGGAPGGAPGGVKGAKAAPAKVNAPAPSKKKH